MLKKNRPHFFIVINIFYMSDFDKLTLQDLKKAQIFIAETLNNGIYGSENIDNNEYQKDGSMFSNENISNIIFYYNKKANIKDNNSKLKDNFNLFEMPDNKVNYKNNFDIVKAIHIINISIHYEKKIKEKYNKIQLAEMKTTQLKLLKKCKNNMLLLEYIELQYLNKSISLQEACLVIQDFCQTNNPAFCGKEFFIIDNQIENLDIIKEKAIKTKDIKILEILEYTKIKTDKFCNNNDKTPTQNELLKKEIMSTLQMNLF